MVYNCKHFVSVVNHAIKRHNYPNSF